MRNLSEKTIAGRTWTFREMTYPQVVQEIRKIRERDENKEPTGLDWLFGRKYMPVDVLEAIVGESVEQFFINENLAPSEIEPLYREAVAINPFFAEALSQMREIADLQRMEMMRLSTSLLQLFSGSPSSSSDGATTDPKSTESPTSSPQ